MKLVNREEIDSPNERSEKRLTLRSEYYEGLNGILTVNQTRECTEDPIEHRMLGDQRNVTKCRGDACV